MKWFSTLLKSISKSKNQEFVTYRQGKYVSIDNAFKAWTSGNLDEMLKAAETKTNPIDRHHLLQSIVKESYKLRKEEKYRKICIKYSEKHLLEFPSLFQALKEDIVEIIPRTTTFQYFATILTEDGKYEKAIEVCQKALSFGLKDSTQSGYEGRIARIKKKIETNK